LANTVKTEFVSIMGNLSLIVRIWGNSFSIQTRLRVERPGITSRQGQWWVLFLFATPPRLALGSTQPPIQQVMGGPHQMALNSNIYKTCIQQCERYQWFDTPGLPSLMIFVVFLSPSLLPYLLKSII